MLTARRFDKKKKVPVLVTVEFNTPGTFTWTAPSDIVDGRVDVFLVGGGGGGGGEDTYGGAGGGGGYTKAFRGTGYVYTDSYQINVNTYIQFQRMADGIRHGNSPLVTAGTNYTVRVGAGGAAATAAKAPGWAGGYSSISIPGTSTADGGAGGGTGAMDRGGYGGSSGGGTQSYIPPGGIVAGSDGDYYEVWVDSGQNGIGQGYTTRDFGEFTGKRNAGGGASARSNQVQRYGGASDYSQGSGNNGVITGSTDTRDRTGTGGGGYGGGGGTANKYITSAGVASAGSGGGGRVLIRFWQLQYV
jgi:hypothetical protein